MVIEQAIAVPQAAIVKFKKLHEDSVLPKYATKGSACFDIQSYYKHFIEPGRTEVIGTGLSVEVPDGYYLELRPRSGLASQGIMLANSPGTIDSDYRGEIKVILHNSSNRRFVVYKTDRIVQGFIGEIVEVEFVEVERLTETERGEGGLGSTGR